MKEDLTPGIIMNVDLASEKAQTLAEIKNASRRYAERMQQITAWSDPEAVAERLREYEEKAAQALEMGMNLSKETREALGLPPEDPPLPPEDELPSYMRGQAPSTIRAMLRHEKWEVDPSLGWKRPKLPGVKVSDSSAVASSVPTERPRLSGSWVAGFKE